MCAIIHVRMSIIKQIKALFSSADNRTIAKWAGTIDKINSFESELTSIADTDFKDRTASLKERLAEGETLDSILPEAFALVREASRRTLGKRHYDVQLIGGLALHLGNIAEMRTGEGKTLVATLPAYLNALTGNGVHIITVNDYLSRRDAVWMAPVYSLLGLSVGVINGQNTSYIYDPTQETKEEKESDLNTFKVQYEFLRPSSRKDAYLADITYGTNNEFGFDYLRDNLVTSVNAMVQRGHHYAIVDEVDSILIDESRTPLIISSATDEAEDLYHTFAKISKNLKETEDYTVDEKLRAISLTDQGITHAEELLGISDIYTEKGIKYVHHLETAIRARALSEQQRLYCEGWRGDHRRCIHWSLAAWETLE